MEEAEEEVEVSCFAGELQQNATVKERNNHTGDGDC